VTIRINLDIVLDGEKEQKVLQLLLEHGAVVSTEATTTPEVTEKAESIAEQKVAVAEELVEVIKKTAAKVERKSSSKKKKPKKHNRGTSWSGEQDNYLLNMWNTSERKKAGRRGFTYTGKEYRLMNKRFGTERSQASIVQRLWNLLNKR
jgi:hypothetical protein